MMDFFLALRRARLQKPQNANYQAQTTLQFYQIFISFEEYDLFYASYKNQIFLKRLN